MQSRRPTRWLLAVATVAAAAAANAAEPAAPTQTTSEGLKYTSTWFGNSWGGGPKWVQTSIDHLVALPDGRLLTACAWDEAHRETSIYSKDGDLIAGVAKTSSSTVGGDTKYVYAVVGGEVDGKKMTGIARYHVDQFETKQKGEPGHPYTVTWAKPAPFADGQGKDKNVAYLVAWVHYEWSDWKRKEEIEENPAAVEKYKRGPAQLRGIVSNGKEVFVSEDLSHRIHVLDAETMREKRSFAFQYPGRIALDGKGHLWVVQRPAHLARPVQETSWLEVGPHKLVELALDGKPTGREISDVRLPGPITTGRPNRRLYVGDNDPKRMQVLVYDVSGTEPKRVAAIGTPGGVYAPPVPGRRKPDKLNEIKGVGVDDEGAVSIASRGPSGGGSFIRRYSPDRRLLWERYTATFMNGSSFDPKFDGTVVYSGRGGNARFELDYSRKAGPLGQWVAVTRAPWRFPQDDRGYHGTVRRLSNGRLYLATDLHTLGTLILRKEPNSEIFVPSVFVSNGLGSNREYPPGRPRDEVGHYARIMWRDVDGDGQMEPEEFLHRDHHQNTTYWQLDSAGDLWEYRDGFKGQRKGCGLLRYKLNGFDEHGNPLWDFNLRKAELFDHVKPFPEDGHRYQGDVTIQQYSHDAATGRMFLAGYPEGYNGPKGGKTGPVLACYEHFTDAARRRLLWTIKLPIGPNRHYPSSFSYAGGYVFVGHGRATKQASIEVYDATTGRSLGAMVPGPRLYGETSWLDIPQAVNAFARSNGEVIVCVENNWKNLQTVYRIPPQPMPGKKSGR